MVRWPWLARRKSIYLAGIVFVVLHRLRDNELTLLLALICDSFVMQVSDRQLSRGGVPEPDERNKAVVWCNSASIAFTGNAYVDYRQTKQVDDWIVEKIAGVTTVQELYKCLVNRAV